MWERGYGLQDVERGIATRTDAPFPVDGLMQTIVASLTLRCDETPWLSIDDPISKFVPAAPEPQSTLRMLMTHTSQGPGGLQFLYRMDRLAPLAPVLAECNDGSFRPAVDGSFRAAVAKFFRRMAMIESVPGADVAGFTKIATTEHHIVVVNVLPAEHMYTADEVAAGSGPAAPGSARSRHAARGSASSS